MGSVNIFRCQSDGTLVTLRKQKLCPKCGGNRFVGAPTYTWWEWVLIQLGVR